MNPFFLAGAAAFLAGLVDAIAGGGGLIQLPALLILFPNLEPQTLFGTNKLASLCGTSLALSQYARRIELDWRGVGPAAGAAFLGSLAGAWVVTQLSSAFLKPMIVGLLVVVLLYTLLKRDLGVRGGETRIPMLWGGLVGAGLGFYDGFFGPGTGSFLVFFFVTVCHMAFLPASASAKVVNAATNIAALLVFSLTGHLWVSLGLALALCNMTGSWVGTRLALKHGSRLVRGLFMVMVSALIVRLLLG